MKSLYDYIVEAIENIDKCNAFVILKPEFLQYKDEWFDMIKNSGWDIEDYIEGTLTLDQCKNLYKVHCDKPFYNDLCKYMSSSDCICAICYKDCDNPIKDMKSIKYKFRDKYGKDDMKNGMHSSDSLKNVTKEKKIIFG